MRRGGLTELEKEANIGIINETEDKTAEEAASEETAASAEKPADGAEKKELNDEIKEKPKGLFRQLFTFHNILIFIGWITCALCGAFPDQNLILSGILLLCVVLSIRNDSFYAYGALFMYFREFMLLGDSTVYRVYSYLLLVKVLLDFKNLKLRMGAMVSLVVYLIFCFFGIGNLSFRTGMQSALDVVVVYLILAKILADDDLMRLYIITFLLGGVASGIFGWTTDASVNVDVGLGATTEITRVYGALYDANYAGYYYTLCIVAAMMVKGLKWWMRAAFGVFFLIVLLETGSLSGLLICLVALVVVTVIRYRTKAVPGLILLFVCLGIFGVIAWNVPFIRNIESVSNIITRISERMLYLGMGQWDRLTTGRYDLWQTATAYFNQQDAMGKMFGGNVITTVMTDDSIFHSDFACHQMYLQSLLCFGIAGTVVIFSSIAAILVYRIVGFFKKGYSQENSDIKMIQISFMLMALLFGLSVDFFVDWRFLFFLLI